MAACAPWWNELLLGTGFHINNQPSAVPATLPAASAGGLNRGQTDPPWHPKNGWSAKSRATLWLKGGLWILLLPFPPSPEVMSHCGRNIFFTLKKEVWNLLPSIQNDFLTFEVLGAHIERITRPALQHRLIPRNYRLIDSWVMGKEGFCSKVIFIANLPVQWMGEKHRPKFPEDAIKLCWWHVLFFQKGSFLHGNSRNSNKCE